MQKGSPPINHTRGFAIIDAILAGALLGLFAIGFVGMLVYGNQSEVLAGGRQRAVWVAEEGLEAVRNIRDEQFSNLSDGTYGLTRFGGAWSFSGAPDITDIFTRSIQIASVDTNTKQVTSSVSWSQNALRSGQVSLVSYLTQWMAATIGDWTAPHQEGSLDLSGNRDGRKIQTSGDYAYIVRDGDSPDFAVVHLIPSSSPTLVGGLTLVGNPTNVAIAGSYAYVTTTDNNAELQIIDVSSPGNPSVLATYDAPGNANAQGVWVDGTTVYIVRTESNQDEFLMVDVSNPANPILISSLNLNATGNEIQVVGSYAYIASSSNTAEFLIVNISTPSLPIITGTLDLSGNEDATTLAVFGNTVVLGRADRSLYLLSISNPTVPVTVGSLPVGGAIYDVALGNESTFVFLVTDDATREFQVIDITTVASPMRIGQIDLPDTMHGVAYHAALDRAFLTGAPNDAEVIVVAPL